MLTVVVAVVVAAPSQTAEGVVAPLTPAAGRLARRAALGLRGAEEARVPRAAAEAGVQHQAQQAAGAEVALAAAGADPEVAQAEGLVAPTSIVFCVQRA